MADNIFGKTFAESRKDSLRNADNLDHEKKKNFNTQLSSDVPLKFWFDWSIILNKILSSKNQKEKL